MSMNVVVLSDAGRTDVEFSIDRTTLTTSDCPLQKTTIARKSKQFMCSVGYATNSQVASND